MPQTAKRPRKPPPALNAPGIWHKRYYAYQEERRQQTLEAQGLAEASPQLLEEVWTLFERAQGHGTLWRELCGQEREQLRALLLRPFRRYADSLKARLAPWRRWERFLATQETCADTTAFAPDPIVAGRFLNMVAEGGPTAASNRWSHLRWWATRLGIQLHLESHLLNDFRFAPQGHQTRQVRPLPCRNGRAWSKLRVKDRGLWRKLRAWCSWWRVRASASATHRSPNPSRTGQAFSWPTA